MKVAMRLCCRCRKEKPEQDFSARRSGALQNYCRDCGKAYHREWYRRNHAKVRPRQTALEKKRYRERQAWVYDYLRTHPCVDCGESDPVVLEFDHVRGKKVLEISELVNKRATLEAIKAEVAKCEVRCCNDHRKKTASQMGWLKGLKVS